MSKCSFLVLGGLFDTYRIMHYFLSRSHILVNKIHIVAFFVHGIVNWQSTQTDMKLTIHDCLVETLLTEQKLATKSIEILPTLVIVTTDNYDTRWSHSLGPNVSYWPQILITATWLCQDWFAGNINYTLPKIIATQATLALNL